MKPDATKEKDPEPRAPLNRYGKANPLLFAIGLVLLLCAAYYSARRIDIALAVLIAAGATAILWALDPSLTTIRGLPVARKLAVPAAFALLIWVVSKAYTPAHVPAPAPGPVPPPGPRHLLLAAQQTATVNGKTVKVRYISTLPDRSLCASAGAVRDVMTGTPQERNRTAAFLFSKAAIELGVASTRENVQSMAESCFDSTQNRDSVDGNWFKLLDDQGNQFVRKADRRPFALLQIGEETVMVRPGTELPQLGPKTNVPAIAAYSKHERPDSGYRSQIVITEQ